MAYHINKNNEAKPCRARIKCRLGGDTGIDNHYESKAEALLEVEKRNHEDNVLNSVSKDSKSNSKNITKLTKEDLNIILNDKSFSSFEEMVEKGYGVNTSDAYKAIPLTGSASMFDISEIDIIETPKYRNAAAAIIAENGMPFKVKE